jgi:hypothetical protein
MAAPIKKADDQPGDQIKFARVIVVSVQRNGVRPGDRYLMTKVEIQPTRSSDMKPEFRFSDYQMASTDYSTINIGTVSVSSQVATTLSATPTFGAAASPSATA